MDNKNITETNSYRKFICAADKCPDTCCKSWDIAVDDDTLAFYNSVGSSITDKLTADDDGDTIIRFENGVCPFLSDTLLCKIQLKYGGQCLCDTCRKFPRITEDYEWFEERLLTLACPEAAKLMIIEREDFSFMYKGEVTSGEDFEYMNFLLKARSMTADIIRGDMPFMVKMRRALAFTENAQSLIDDEIFDEELLSEYETFQDVWGKTDRSAVFKAHEGLDVMDKAWLDRVVKLKAETIPASLDDELSSLVLYYIARYYLTAFSSCDIITTVKRAYFAAVVCAALICDEHAECDETKRALIHQKYSKEIEHSDENTEILAELFLTDTFSSEKLI